MVYGLNESRDWAIQRKIEYFTTRGALFRGPQSFEFWATAVAYALLPADPSITQTGRRRVRRGSSGRWIVTQTHERRRLPCEIEAHMPRPQTMPTLE